MADPSTLRKKASRLFKKAAAATTACQAEKLKEAAQQLELWADDLENNADASDERFGYHPAFTNQDRCLLRRREILPHCG
jgi:hypothetical protein